MVGLAELLETNLDEGIHGDDADLVRRRNAFGSNNYPRKGGRSFWVNIIHFWSLDAYCLCSFLIPSGGLFL